MRCIGADRGVYCSPLLGEPDEFVISVTTAEQPSQTVAGRAPHGAALFIAALAAAGFALTVTVFYPGYLTTDAGYVYRFMQAWSFGDWQSPLMSMIWWLVDPIAPGAGSMFLLIASLYWLSFAVLALTIARCSAWIGIAVPIVALTPPAFFMLGMIWRDVLFAVFWLLAGALAFAAADRRTALRWPAQALALSLVAVGILLRPNAIIAAPLLAAYVVRPVRFEWKRTALAFAPLLLAGYALVHVVYYNVLEVERQHPLHSLFVFDLGGITYFTAENQFPVSWSAQETALLESRCYDPGRWDSYWTIAPCDFVMRRLESKHDPIFGTSRLTQAWTRALAAHPIAYLQHRLTVFWRFLAGENLTLELFNADDPEKTPLARNRYFQALRTMHASLQRTVLFRTGFWLVLAGIVGLFAWRARATPCGAFAIGVSASALVYVMTFFVVGVASDFRYGYWCVLAALGGGAAALAARRDRFADFAGAARKPPPPP